MRLIVARVREVTDEGAFDECNNAVNTPSSEIESVELQAWKS
jgi:hypothetical protein